MVFSASWQLFGKILPIRTNPQGVNITTMSSINPPTSSTSTTPELFTPPSYLLLELGTICLLGAIIVQKAVGETIISCSQTSEEIFRGDRLPVLPFPYHNGMADNTDNAVKNG